mmetsp:Transcript_66277/g.158125  ORF Transcript_66277/g.158125 Transcript_66277/m.158125 type:complete len:574 (+) Transcript_66277:248-1969(+)
MHGLAGHPIAWHIDDTSQQPIEKYNARRRQNVAGDGAKEVMSGNGHRVENRTKYIPFEAQTEYEDKRHWRNQARDDTGRTVIARTLEHAYVQEFERTQAPDRNGRKLIYRNIDAVKEKSERNRRTQGRQTPLSDAELLQMGDAFIDPRKTRSLAGWLATASVEDKTAFRDLVAGIRNDTHAASRARAPVSAPPGQRPASSAGLVRVRTPNLGRKRLGVETEARLIAIRAKIKGKLPRPDDRKDLRTALDEHDTQNNGYILFERLIEVMSAFGILPTQTESTALEALLDHHATGSIHVATFLSECVPPDPFATMAPHLTRPGASQTDNENMMKCTNAELLEIILVKMRERSGPSSLRQSFRFFDTDRSGKVDVNELQKVLESMEIHIPQEQAVSLINTFDPDGSGEIDFYEFFNKVLEPDVIHDVPGAMLFGKGRPPSGTMIRRKPPTPLGRKQQRFYMPSSLHVSMPVAHDGFSIVEGLRNQLRDLVWQRYSSLREVLRAMLKFCGDNQSKIGIAAFRRFLKHSMIAASPQEAQALLERMDADGDGFLNFNDLTSSIGPLAPGIQQRTLNPKP